MLLGFDLCRRDIAKHSKSVAQNHNPHATFRRDVNVEYILEENLNSNAYFQALEQSAQIIGSNQGRNALNLGGN